LLSIGLIREVSGLHDFQCAFQCDEDASPAVGPNVVLLEGSPTTVSHVDAKLPIVAYAILAAYWLARLPHSHA
jgi:hypothetical protein